MLDPEEMAWLDEQLTGDVEHLFIGTSLPFLLPPGLHDFEAIDEVLADGAHGRLVGTVAERGRRSIDLEHWAAFNEGFAEVFDIVMDVARGNRGRAPSTIAFLSGDVHNSYVAEVTDAAARHGAQSRIVQAVCSPIRNPMPRAVRVMMSAFARSLVRPMRFIAERSKRVPDPAYPWLVTDGPWFDNCLAEATVQGSDLAIVWRGGEVRGGDDLHPVLTTVGAVRVPGRHADDAERASARVLLTKGTPSRDDARVSTIHPVARRLQIARRASNAYRANHAVAAVLVAGSVARGLADDASDIELDVYWSRPRASRSGRQPSRAPAGTASTPRRTTTSGPTGSWSTGSRSMSAAS